MGSSFVEIGRPTYHVVKLEIEENCFIGDATKCCDGTPDKNKNLLLSKLLKRSIGIYYKNEIEQKNLYFNIPLFIG